MRTGPSKPIFDKMCAAEPFSPAKRTMVTKNNSVRGPEYNPNETRPPTGNEDWQRWQFVYTGNARVPCWIVRVPKEIIWGHGGLWSDNSVAMFGALYRMHFPLNAEGHACSFSTDPCSQGPRHPKTEPGQAALKPHDTRQRRPLRTKNSQ